MRLLVSLTVSSSTYHRRRSRLVLCKAYATGIFTLGNALTPSTLLKPVTVRVLSASGERASALSMTVLCSLVLALNFAVCVISTILVSYIGYRRTICCGAFLVLAMLGFRNARVAFVLDMRHVGRFWFRPNVQLVRYKPSTCVLNYFF